jgi:hypothetical protein
MEKAGKPSLTVEDLKKALPDWAKEVQCPVCHRLMTPIRVKPDNQWGETVTYQCHNNLTPDRICFAVVQLTTTVRYFMRPGDFSNSEFDWRQVAPETIPATPQIAAQQSPSTFTVPAVPPCPWIRETASQIAWNSFWGPVRPRQPVIRPVAEILQAVVKAKGDTPKVHKLIDTLPTWMAQRTGYVVAVRSGKFELIGKTTGSLEPYTDAAYRKKHGFE